MLTLCWCWWTRWRLAGASDPYVEPHMALSRFLPEGAWSLLWVLPSESSSVKPRSGPSWEGHFPRFHFSVLGAPTRNLGQHQRHSSFCTQSGSIQTIEQSHGSGVSWHPGARRWEAAAGVCAVPECKIQSSLPLLPPTHVCLCMCLCVHVCAFVHSVGIEPTASRQVLQHGAISLTQT